MRKLKHNNSNSDDYASDLTLRRHAESYTTGSIAESNDTMPKEMVPTLSPQLVEEARTRARLHDRPLDQVINATVKSLRALQAAIADQREAGAAERHVAPREFDLDDSNAISPVHTNTSVKHQSSTSFRVRI